MSFSCRKALIFVLLAAVSCQQSEGLFRGRDIELRFLDGQAFDSQLSSAMREQAAVVAVEMITDVSPTRIPERLDRWFYAIHQKGGVVRAEVDPSLPKERSSEAVLAAISLGIQIYRYVREQRMYGAAEPYGALVYIDPARDRITRVLFVRVPDA